MIQLVTEPVEVVDRGLYDDSKPEFGEFVKIKGAAADAVPLRYTLDKSVNGEVKVGAKLRLVVVARDRPVAHSGRDGRLGVHYETKYKVVGVAA